MNLEIVLVALVVGLAGVVVFLLATRGRAKGGRPATAAIQGAGLSGQSEIILNSIEDGVVLIDKDEVIRLFNPGAGNLSGWSPQEAVGLSFRSVFKLVDAKGEWVLDEQNPFARILREQQPIHSTDVVLVTKSNNQVRLNLNISPLLDANNQLTGAVAVFRDVTAERQAEQQRADFISTASHEMRTPVAAIEGYLALALNDKVSTIDNRARGYLDKAHNSTQHLGKLFQDLLTSAKAEDGRLTSHPEVIEFGSFLEQVASDLKFAAEKKGLFLEFITGGSSHTKVVDATRSEGGEKVVRPLYYVYADQERLREVITNLFDNAVKYTEQGRITVGLTGDDRVVQMYIRDTGAGIPAEDLPHLFQKFYRVDNSATRTIGGTGLGLFICRKIVEMYQGRIWVESQLEKGSTFYINFPRLSSDKAAKLQTSSANSGSQQPGQTVTAQSPS